jgi:hypothetical protein
MSLGSRKSVWLFGLVGVLALLGWFSASAQPASAPEGGMVKVIGLVVKPGEYPWREGMTVRELVREADGLAPFASKKVRVLDLNPAWYAEVGRQAGARWADLANGVHERLATVWEALHLPGESPDLMMAPPKLPSKATVNLRMPTSNYTL